MLSLNHLPERKYLEAQRFLQPVALLDTIPLLNHFGLRLTKERRDAWITVSSADKVWTLKDGIFYRRPERDYPDYVVYDDLLTFTARFCGSVSKGLSTLREVYASTPMFAETLYTDQVAQMCSQFLSNKMIVENIVRRGQLRAVRNQSENPGWYKLGITSDFAGQMTPLKFSASIAALKRRELNVLGCSKAQIPDVRYTDGSIPVLYYCSNPATVSEMHFPGNSYLKSDSWYFRCGKTEKSVPAFASFAFSGLRALPFEPSSEVKVYSRPDEYFNGEGITGTKLATLLVGRGISMEQVFQPLRSKTAYAFMGNAPAEYTLRLVSFFRNLNVYCTDATRHTSTTEVYDSIMTNVRADFFAGNMLHFMQIEEPERLEGALRMLSTINFGPDRARHVVSHLDLSSTEQIRIFNSLCGSGAKEESAIALDSKHTLSADPCTSTIVDTSGTEHLVYNFKVFFEEAILFGDGGTADHYTIRVIFSDKDGKTHDIKTTAGRRVATSWRDMAACVKHACDREGIDFEPAAIDITYAAILQKHWLAMIDRAPFVRGNTFLGFSTIPGGGFVFPGTTVRPPELVPSQWTPHPADAALSHYTLPESSRSPKLSLVYRPAFRLLMGYCVATSARYMLGQEIKPLVIRDSAEARFICTNFFKGFGQLGPLFIRQTDGAGVYKKIFSALAGYPMWCLGPAKAVSKPMRGPVIVLDSEDAQEISPDTELLHADIPSTVFRIFSSWLLHFMQSPEMTLSKLKAQNPCSAAEGAVLLAFAMPGVGWENFEEFYPLLGDVLMDIPKEMFPTLLIQSGGKVLFTPYTWTTNRSCVKGELNANGVAAQFHGVNALSFSKDEAVKFRKLVNTFYEWRASLPDNHE